MKRTFTELGFDKGKLPLDLFADMSTYYYNNRHQKFREEWDGKGLYVNWWEQDAFMIALPNQLKSYWQARSFQCHAVYLLPFFTFNYL